MKTHWVTFLAQRRGGLQPHATGKTVNAYVSENRWVADCPGCNGGIACWSENPEGCCLTCGGVYKVAYPADHKAATKVLEQRPPAARHWNPAKETVAQLEQENKIMLGITPVADPNESGRYQRLLVPNASAAAGLAQELLTRLKTGYTIRDDDESGAAEVELIGHTAKQAAELAKSFGVTA